MADIVKLALVLFIVSMVAGLAIALTNKQTCAKIEEQKKQAEQNALNAVFSEGTSIEKQPSIESLNEPYWIGKKDGELIGYAFKGSDQGFSSHIKFIVGIDPKGVILGLTILDHNETPGLGTRVKEVVSKKYFWNGLLAKKEQDTPWFCKQFKGILVTKNINIDKTNEWHKLKEEQKGNLLVDNSITALTGATISTKAVCSGIKKYAYKYLSALKTEEI